jgi:hypothetical protein
MEYNELLTKENLSTIFVWLWIIVGPYLVEYMNRDQFVALGVVIIGIIGAVYSSKHPNKLGCLGNAPTPVDSTEPVLNDEYECDDNGC